MNNRNIDQTGQDDPVLIPIGKLTISYFHLKYDRSESVPAPMAIPLSDGQNTRRKACAQHDG